MRGFVFSLIAVSFMLLLVFLAIATANGYAEGERSYVDPQAISYSSAALDFLGRQYSDILLPNSDLIDGNGTITLRISDTVPRSGISSSLNELNAFVANNLTQLTHANVTVNTSMVNSISVEALIADTFTYRNGYNGTRAFYFGKLGGSTGAKNYSLNISVDDYRSSISPFAWDPTGDMNVTIYYSDYNGTDLARGKLRSDVSNSLSIAYSNGSRIDLLIGLISVNGSWSQGAMQLSATNGTSLGFSLDALLPSRPYNYSENFVFPIPITYSQDGITKTAYVTK